MNGVRRGPAAVATSGRIGYEEEQEVAMAENAAHTTEHATEDQNGSTAVIRDEADEAAQARRVRQMALIDGIMRDYETVLRELGQR